MSIKKILTYIGIGIALLGIGVCGGWFFCDKYINSKSSNADAKLSASLDGIEDKLKQSESIRADLEQRIEKLQSDLTGARDQYRITREQFDKLNAQITECVRLADTGTVLISEAQATASDIESTNDDIERTIGAIEQCFNQLIQAVKQCDISVQ